MNSDSWSTYESVATLLFLRRYTPHLYSISRRALRVLGSDMFCSKSIIYLKCSFEVFFLLLLYSFLPSLLPASVYLSVPALETRSVVLSPRRWSSFMPLIELLVLRRTSRSSYFCYPIWPCLVSCITCLSLLFL